MDYKDLRHKTAFDFCTEQEAKAWFLDDMELSRQEYLEEANADDTFRALGLMDVADAKDDATLMAAVKREFKTELDDFFDGAPY